MVLIRPQETTLNSRFLRYWLNSPLMATHTHGQRDGSVAERLNLPTIRSLPIPIPPMSEQLEIAHILGSLDDRIELNRRMSGTLEAMARALFKSWFVDFEPVRAKAEGRETGLPRVLDGLFPESFDDSEVGEIPRGWKARSLGDLLELAYGKALKSEDRRAGKVPVYGSNGQVGWHDERLVHGPGIVVGRKGTPGTVSWIPTDFFPIDTAFFVLPRLECRCLEYLYFALRGQHLPALSADSAVPGLNRNLAYQNCQLLPPVELLEQFGHLAGAILSRVGVCAGEAQSLLSIREALLPGLVSGAIDVGRVAAAGSEEIAGSSQLETCKSLG